MNAEIFSVQERNSVHVGKGTRRAIKECEILHTICDFIIPALRGRYKLVSDFRENCDRG